MTSEVQVHALATSANAADVWAMLQVSGAVIAIGFPVILWNAQSVLDSVAEIERGPGNRLQELSNLASSPQLLFLLLGLIYIVATSVLSGAILVSAILSSNFRVGFLSIDFALLSLCLLAPVGGAAVIFFSVATRVGSGRWFVNAVSPLVGMFYSRRLDQAVDNGDIAVGVDDVALREVRTLLARPELKVHRSSWQQSEEWCRLHLVHWGLGRNFLQLNGAQLSALALTKAAEFISQLKEWRVDTIEQSVAAELKNQLRDAGALLALIHDRPDQLARTCLALAAARSNQ